MANKSSDQALDQLLNTYSQVQKAAPFVAAQPSDDFWTELEAAFQAEWRNEEAAKNLVSPRGPAPIE